jgi:molybdate transport system substrate-binding protein
VEVYSEAVKQAVKPTVKREDKRMVRRCRDYVSDGYFFVSQKIESLWTDATKYGFSSMSEKPTMTPCRRADHDTMRSSAFKASLLTGTVMPLQSASPELHLLSALVVRSPFDALVVPQYEAMGGRVRVDWNPTTVIVKNINAGLRADLLLLTIEAMDDFIASGIIDVASNVALLRSNIGIGVMEDASSPDIGSVDALSATLLAARSVAYSLGGASGIHFASVIEKLGIADQINARATTIPEGFTAEKLVTGEADLAVQQISELLTVKGIKIVGPLPAAVQKTTSFAVAAFAGSPNREAARQFIAHLCSEPSREAYRRFGLEPMQP